MGNKVSAVNGVRSHNFYKPGNAINQIWLGKFEVVSRLPFGDSDMAQAGWPAGGWPKIPWHQFIIPLKRRSVERSEPPSTASPAIDAAKQEIFSDMANRIQSALSQGLKSEMKSFRGFSSWPWFIVACFLVPVVLVAYCIPVALTYDPPSSCSLRTALFFPPNKRVQKKITPKKQSQSRAYTATFVFIQGVVCSLLEFCIWPAIRIDPETSNPSLTFGLDTLKIIAGVFIVWRFFYAAKAVCYNWADWKRTQKVFADDDCKCMSSVAEP